jgi:hypothetical protein
MAFRSRRGLDNLREASYYFASLNPEARNLRKQTFRGASSHSEMQTVFVLSPLATLLVIEEKDLPESY